MLKVASPHSWLNTVLNDFDTFLLDHAACERKASSMAMSMLLHYADKPALVKAMTDLALEELSHFRQVTHIILERQLVFKADEKDVYINQLHKNMRTEKADYFMDRLLIASIVEARGHERFTMIADGLPTGKLKEFYKAIAKSEARHFELFLDLANQYCPQDKIDIRLNELLIAEANILEGLPLRPILH